MFYVTEKKKKIVKKYFFLEYFAMVTGKPAPSGESINNLMFASGSITVDAQTPLHVYQLGNPFQISVKVVRKIVFAQNG